MFYENFLNLYPMRAKGVKPENIPWSDSNYVFEEKHDGDRRFLWISKGRNHNTSRSKSRKTGLPVDKTDNTPHIRDLDIPELYDTLFDCEFTHNRGFREGVRKIMGCLPEKAISRQEEWGYIEVQLFDILCYKGDLISDWPYSKRRALLEELYEKHFKNNEHFNIIRQIHGTPEELQEELSNIISNGGEGMIAKNIHSDYRMSNEKCMSPLKNAWVKVKKEFNGDFVVSGFEPPKIEYDGKHVNTHQFWLTSDGDKLLLNGKSDAVEYSDMNGVSLIPITKYHYYNWIGGIKFSEYKDDRLVEVGTVSSGLSEDLRAEVSANPNKYFGKVMELDAMERDNKSFALRHPVFIRFRDDKNAEDCIYENQKG